MDKQKKRYSSFSLIETLLYIAILSIFLGGVITFAWDAIYSNVKSKIQQDITNNGKFVTSKLSYLIRNSDGIVLVTPDFISLDMSISDPTKHPTEISLNNGQILVGYGNNINCGIANPCTITTNQLTVTNLSFQNLSTATNSSENIKYDLTIENTSERQEFNDIQSFTSSVEIR